MTPFARTVLGDIPTAELGVTYAHEHLVIDGGRPVQMFPDFDLSDVDMLLPEVVDTVAKGLRTAVDAMPADAGRNVIKLADLSRRAGLNVIASTGLHHDRYYGPAHWSHRLSAEELAVLFEADIVEGIDELDYSGPLVRRTRHRAGVIKVAGREGGLSARDKKLFEAAAIAHARTRAPILTHCEHGTGALEQLAYLADRGIEPRHVTVSHVDKIVDRPYHREITSTGAFAEFDQAFRWGDGVPNGTLTVLEWLAEDDLDGQIVLGMDAARQRYYRAYGGGPGLGYLLDAFSAALDGRGFGETIRRRLFVDNPARAFAFAPPPTDEEAT